MHLLPPLLTCAVDVLRLCAWLVLLTAIFVPLERLFALRPQPVLRRAALADIGFYFLNSLLPNLILSLPLAAVIGAAHALLPAGYAVAMARLPFWGRAGLALVVAETGFYWGHRWSHEIPLLWRFHAVHHDAAHLDFLVNTRAHPVDMVFTRLCGLAPLYALGIVPQAGRDAGLLPLVLVLVGTVWGFFIHANLRCRLGWLEHLVATPAFHHWHHTQDGAIDRNYAALLPCLDRLFGTFHLPARQWPESYGIAAAIGSSENREMP